MGQFCSLSVYKHLVLIYVGLLEPNYYFSYIFFNAIAEDCQRNNLMCDLSATEH